MAINPLKLEPGARVGHYTVESLISSGGFGAVYRVTRDGKSFALKVPLTRAASDEGRKVTEARIVREVVALMSLKHPCIVGVHGFDRWPDPVNGALYLVMDFVDGQPIAQWQRQTAATLREVLDVFVQLAVAVEVMHRKGVVHRDIKASNVLVSLAPASSASETTDATRLDRGAHSTGSAPRSGLDCGGAPAASRAADATVETRVAHAGSAPRAVLVDFGLARPAFTTDVTAEHVVVGTEGSLAPELLATSGKHFHYTPATDLYALGCLFFEVLTGLASPYASANCASGRRIRIPSNVARGLPSALDPIVTGLLFDDPKHRTASALELARQLDAVLSDDSWGDTLPVEAQFIAGRSPLDLEGRFMTRAERQSPLPTPAAEPTSTAERSGHATLPLFVLDSEETLAGLTSAVVAPPAPPVTAKRQVLVSPMRARLGAAAAVGRQVLRYAAEGTFITVVLVAFFGLLSVVLPPPPVLDGTQVPPWEAPPPSQPSPVVPRAEPKPEVAPATPQPPTARPSAPEASRARPTPPVLARAMLVGHVRPGAVHAVLRQPLRLSGVSLPTGAALDGTADALPDGRFLLRFDSAPRPNGSTHRIRATALVEARAGIRHPLVHGAHSRDGFEFDLQLTPPQ